VPERPAEDRETSAARLVQDLRRRAALTLALGAFFVVGYYTVAFLVDAEDSRSLATPLDEAIPFIASSIYVYAWTYTALLSPLFTVRCPRLFDRVALAYALVIAAALPCFLLFPVSAVSLRAPINALDPSRFSEWGVLLNYTLDPPTNLFPSIHMAIVTVAVAATWRARRAYGLAGLCLAVAIGVSICTVKQHYVLDGVAGVALGLLAYRLAMRSYATRDGEEAAFGWRGPALYLAFHTSIYAALFGVFRSGWLPT
jgi:membrane-associated phospholipid phosphatase